MKYFYILFMIAFFQSGLTAQNQVYWKEGFEPSGPSPCNLTTTAPTSNTTAYFTGNAGQWYGFNVLRTPTATGAGVSRGCPNGTPNHHVRYKNIFGVTDSGYLVTPIVNFGIQELHISRGQAFRRYNIWITNDTAATTTNWVPVVIMQPWSSTITCVDTTVRIASPTAKRLKITAWPGNDSDVDSIWLTSYSLIVVPIELISFTATTEGSKTNLTWATASEINNKGYDIERSRDGQDFQSIGTVKGIGKAANYNFVDANPYNGINYYRLKQVDFDGKETLSKVVSVTTTGKGTSKIKIFPTNTEGSVSIESGQLTVDNVQVFNNVGQLVLSSGATSRLDLSAMPSGLYLVQVKAGSETVTEKVFKR